MTLSDIATWVRRPVDTRPTHPPLALDTQLGHLSTPARLIHPDTPVQAVDRLFNDDVTLRSVVLHAEGASPRLIDRLWFGHLMSGRLGFGRMLHTRSRMRDLDHPDSLVLDHDTSIDAAAVEILTRSRGSSTLDGLVTLGPDGLVSVVQVRAIFEGLTRQFAHQSMHDPLTGLPNRLYLMHRLGSMQPTELRALLYVDLDRFKEVNDRYGHGAGDEVLVQFASRLTQSCRADDVVVRLGGDEFAVLISAGLTDMQLSGFAERLVLVAAAPFTVRDQRHQERSASIGASVGVATAASLEPEERVSSLEVLLKKADLAMYRAKAQGRGRIQTFESDRAVVEAEAQARYARNSLERRLRAAIDDRAIAVHYQPIVALPAGDVVHVEALARWEDAEHGTVAPDVFIPLAEQSGMIGDLGEHVLRTACRDTAAWARRRTGVPATTPPGVAVNVSALQLADRHFVSMIAAALAESGLPAGLLVIEITESTQLADVPDTVKVLARLRSMGVRVALDDFGTGRSSLELLRTLPLDVVKIDRGFVHAMSRSAADHVLLRLCVDAAHALGLTVCAEGVEDAGHLDGLRRLGVDTAQGWLFGRPCPVDELDLGQAHLGHDQDRHVGRDGHRPGGAQGEADVDRTDDDEFVVVTDAAMLVRFVSTSIADVLGIAGTQIVGTPVGGWVHVDDRTLALSLPPHHEGLAERVVRTSHADGSLRWLRVRSETRVDDSGGASVVSRCRDVTSLVRAHERSADLESTFMRVFDDAPTGMALSDLGGRLLRVNTAFAAMLGVSSEQLRGRTVESITHPDDLGLDTRNLHAQAIGASEGAVVAKRYRCADASYVRVRVTTSVVPDRSGQPRQIVAHIEPLSTDHPATA